VRHRQQRHQALPTREDLGVVAVLSEQRRTSATVSGAWYSNAGFIGNSDNRWTAERRTWRGRKSRTSARSGRKAPVLSTLMESRWRTTPRPMWRCPATVVLLRALPTASDLMLRRDTSCACRWAWCPWGRIDAEDYPGGRLSDDPDAVFEAARNAAARESMEEAGLSSILQPRVVRTPDTADRFRHPAAVATWFFAAAPSGAVVVDDGEIRAHQWIRPADALRRRDAGEILIIPPTWITLNTLARGIGRRPPRPWLANRCVASPASARQRDDGLDAGRRRRLRRRRCREAGPDIGCS
jgi:ADP-ribose pyrophosphatase YjhB (NUDIX family)